jgi:hypothetical protein
VHACDRWRRGVDEVPVVHVRRVAEVRAEDALANLLVAAFVAADEEEQGDEPLLVDWALEQRFDAGKREVGEAFRDAAGNGDADADDRVSLAVAAWVDLECPSNGWNACRLGDPPELTPELIEVAVARIGLVRPRRRLPRRPLGSRRGQGRYWSSGRTGWRRIVLISSGGSCSLTVVR